MWLFAGLTANGIASDVDGTVSDVWRLDLEAGAVVAGACEMLASCARCLVPSSRGCQGRQVDAAPHRRGPVARTSISPHAGGGPIRPALDVRGLVGVGDR